MCALLGADAATGLTKDQFFVSYYKSGMEDIAKDLAKVRAAEPSSADDAWPAEHDADFVSVAED